MRTVSIFRSKRKQTIRLPSDFEFEGVTELSIERNGDIIVLRPVRPNWTSLADEPRPAEDFLRDRPELIEEGRFSLDEERQGDAGWRDATQAVAGIWRDRADFDGGIERIPRSRKDGFETK